MGYVPKKLVFCCNINITHKIIAVEKRAGHETNQHWITKAQVLNTMSRVCDNWGEPSEPSYMYIPHQSHNTVHREEKKKTFAFFSESECTYSYA